MHWELIKLRKENNITKTDMARLLNLTITTYTTKEDGKADFKLPEMFTIAKFFDKTIENIFLPTYINDNDKGGK